MKKSILIVDDDKSTCSSIAKALSNDYKIHTAFNGNDALNILNKNKEIQIILTDVVMPEMSGLDGSQEYGCSRLPDEAC